MNRTFLIVTLVVSSLISGYFLAKMIDKKSKKNKDKALDPTRPSRSDIKDKKPVSEGKIDTQVIDEPQNSNNIIKDYSYVDSGGIKVVSNSLENRKVIKDV